MKPLRYADFEAMEIADNARRKLAKRNAAAAATRAFWDYINEVLAPGMADRLLGLLTDYPDHSLELCLNSLGYTVTRNPEPPGPLCYVAILDHANDPGFDILRVFVDSDAAHEFSEDTDAGRGTYILEAPFEPMLPTLPDGIDLDIFAYDIADTMDRGEHGLDEIGQDDIRAALPAFIAAAQAHAAARDAK